MKTISQIAAEITELSLEIPQLEKEVKNTNQHRKNLRLAAKKRERVSYLNSIIDYLRTNPTEEFLIKEKTRLTNRISLLFNTYQSPNPDRTMKANLTKHRKKFEKEMGIPEINKHLKNIEFLLG